jgi:hypothetical protein
MIDALCVGLAGVASPEHVADDLRAAGAMDDSAPLCALASRLSSFLTTTPDRIRILTRLAADPHHGRAVAFGLAQVLEYVFDEHDLVSDASHGVLGLLDDAYLVHRFLEDVGRAYPEARALAASADDGATRDLVARLLPAGVAAALDRTSERLLQVGATLFTAAATIDQGTARCEATPALRLEHLLR